MSNKNPNIENPNIGNPNIKRKIDEMIRVNHAGEYAANVIYEAQLKYWRDDASLEEIKHMKEQEARHLTIFEEEMRARRVRPSALLPLWKLLAHGVGAITATMGKEAGMACTSEVEEVIGKHYEEQLSELDSMEEEKELRDKIHGCYLEEMEHMNTAIENGAKKTKAYPLLSAIIKCGSRAAIKIAKKV